MFTDYENAKSNAEEICYNSKSINTIFFFNICLYH